MSCSSESHNPFLEYDLPAERIAQRPIGRGEARSQSKLLRARFQHQLAGSLEIYDRCFSDLPDLIRSDDLLVLNDTAVVPSRFFVKIPNSEREVEILMTRRHSVEPEAEVWEALARPMRRLKEGLSFEFADGLTATCLGRTANESRVLLEVRSKEAGASVGEELAALGLMPIPPYIRGGMADELDRETYQTVMANEPGSVACPTAGLHFSENLLSAIANKGVTIAPITLHVGTASFSPIRDANIAQHQMTEESYCLNERSCQEICRAKREGRRVIAVGTTCVRALESGARLPEYNLLTGDDTGADTYRDRDSNFIPTDLFITPGFDFKVVDCLITNFHQPCTTHLLLVGAFAGCDNIDAIYCHALAGDYRFLSYGDSMLLEPQSKGLERSTADGA